MRVKEGGMHIIKVLLLIIIGVITVTTFVPAYHAYTIRARVAEGIQLANSAKAAVVKTFQSTHTIPNQDSTGYISLDASANPHVDNIKIANDGTGTITISFKATAGGGTITFVPDLGLGLPIVWDCRGGTTKNNYRPPVCR